MLDLGIHRAAIGGKFLVEGLWKRNPHNREYETLVNGDPVHILGQTMIVFRLASGDCREIMAAQVDISPDVDGLVLGMEWMHKNTCMWNVRTSKVSAIDDIVFHAEYERDARLAKRVMPLPDEAHAASFVAALDLNLPMDWGIRPSPRVCGVEDEEQPVDIEELLPIRISHITEPEPEQPGAVGVVTTRLGSEGALADPESSMSDVTVSPPESDYEDEAESESSERDRGELEQPDPPRESTSVRNLNRWMTAMIRPRNRPIQHWNQW